jgi:hypothetical protein
MYDAPGDTVVITEYSLWRRIDDLDGAVSVGSESAGRMPHQLTYPPGDWHYVGSVPARGENVYSCVVPTLCDSTSEGMCWSTFFVSAMTPDPLVYFDSEPDSGYSVDNLAPAPPADLRMPTPVELAWDEAQEDDFDYFTVYGSDVSELDETAEVIGFTIGTSLDVSEHLHDYYHVTATDFSGNEGDASSVENPHGGMTNAETLPTVFSFYQNEPNPFEALTVIRFEVPRLSELSIKIYDTEGRLVRTLIDGRTEPGRHAVTWTGDDTKGSPVGPGIYFVRFEAGSHAESEKMLLLR